VNDKLKVLLTGERVASFCADNHIKRLSLFGSALEDEMTETSDIDLLVEFEEDSTPGFFGLSEMEQELAKILGGRRIDLRTLGDLSRYFRDEVRKTSVVVYGAT
jgi:predicted nucleotidyltransferase